jgi:hypothetical protein
MEKRLEEGIRGVLEAKRELRRMLAVQDNALRELILIRRTIKRAEKIQGR